MIELLVVLKYQTVSREISPGSISSSAVLLESETRKWNEKVKLDLVKVRCADMLTKLKISP